MNIHKIELEPLNLIYFKDRSKNGNFGDELSVFITSMLLDDDKFRLCVNQNDVELNVTCIGSFLHMAKPRCFIFGSGMRTEDQVVGKDILNTLNFCAIRGPLTRARLKEKGCVLDLPHIFGDPALLLPMFYTPSIIDGLRGKIGLIPHKSNIQRYSYENVDKKNFYIISPIQEWKSVIDQIYSCKYIISSSLHGLICADAFKIPNVWLDEYKLEEGHFKFHDYFASQKRNIIRMRKLSEFRTDMLYHGGNNICLDTLVNAFPFRKQKN